MKNIREQIENILIQMMPIGPTFPTAKLAKADRESRLAAIEKATNRLLILIEDYEVGKNENRKLDI